MHRQNFCKLSYSVLQTRKYLSNLFKSLTSCALVNKFLLILPMRAHISRNVSNKILSSLFLPFIPWIPDACFLAKCFLMLEEYTLPCIFTRPADIKPVSWQPKEYFVYILTSEFGKWWYKTMDLIICGLSICQYDHSQM